MNGGKADMYTLQRFESPERFYDAVADCIARHIFELMKSAYQLCLFLSGGTTPEPVYERLSTYVLPWKQITLALVDERWVDETDPGSNAALIQRSLIASQASETVLVPMKTAHASAKAAQDDVERTYAALVRQPSLAILGMGTDGHIGAWFPKADGLEEVLDLNSSNSVQAIMALPSKVTGPYLERITLTLTALQSCQALILLIKGPEKLAILNNAIENRPADVPISYLLDKVGDKLTIFYLNA